MAPDTAIIIPARHASTRYPGKPLALVAGASGTKKPLIQRTYEAACRVSGVSSVHVATDSIEIRDVAMSFGADVIMTSSACENGTERCADALSRRPDLQPDIVINFQGDALLTPAYFIDAIIERFAANPETEVATPIVKCKKNHYEKLVLEEQAGRVGGTSAVFDKYGRALYFSKRLIPYNNLSAQTGDPAYAYLHIGIYGYSYAALENYATASKSLIEELEGLEQLRFLHHGVPVNVVELLAPEWEIWELNNPSDLEPIEIALRQMGTD